MVPVNGSGEPSIPPASPSQRHKGQCTRSVAVHPIRRGAMPTDRVQRPNQQEQTRYRQVNRCHHHKQTAQWPPPGRAESGNLQTRQSPDVWRAPSDCWSRLRRPWAATRPGRASRSITPSRRLACGDLAGGPPPTGAPSSRAQQGQPLRRPENSRSAQQQAQQQAQQRGRKPTACAPHSDPSARSPDTLTAWRPRS